MNCQQFQEKYMIHQDSPEQVPAPELQEHLASCPDCREFVRILDLLSSSSGPSAEQDRRVLNSFRIIRRRKTVARRYAGILLPLAAALLILCTMAVLHLGHPDAPSGVLAPQLQAEARTSEVPLQEWDLQLMTAADEIENMELEMAFLLSSI